MAPSIENSTHIVVLIDRSGSMATIASDVIGGFNTFVDDQRSNGNDARMSVIQFDSQDPQDVTVWGAPLAEITHLTGQTFQPRGGTPLLDATGLAIGRAKVDGEARVAAGLDAYNDAERMGIHAGDTQQWKRDGANARLAFSSTSTAIKNIRDKKRRYEETLRGSAFETGKDAEEQE